VLLILQQGLRIFHFLHKLGPDRHSSLHDCEHIRAQTHSLDQLARAAPHYVHIQSRDESGSDFDLLALPI
jgi:hypothetical protein